MKATANGVIKRHTRATLESSRHLVTFKVFIGVCNAIAAAFLVFSLQHKRNLKRLLNHPNKPFIMATQLLETICSIPLMMFSMVSQFSKHLMILKETITCS